MGLSQRQNTEQTDRMTDRQRGCNR